MAKRMLAPIPQYGEEAALHEEKTKPRGRDKERQKAESVGDILSSEFNCTCTILNLGYMNPFFVQVSFKKVGDICNPRILTQAT